MKESNESSCTLHCSCTELGVTLHTLRSSSTAHSRHPSDGGDLVSDFSYWGSSVGRGSFSASTSAGEGMEMPVSLQMSSPPVTNPCTHPSIHLSFHLLDHSFYHSLPTHPSNHGSYYASFPSTYSLISRCIGLSNYPPMDLTCQTNKKPRTTIMYHPAFILPSIHHHPTQFHVCLWFFLPISLQASVPHNLISHGQSYIHPSIVDG